MLNLCCFIDTVTASVFVGLATRSPLWAGAVFFALTGIIVPNLPR
jgi:hypothetical protein